MCTLCRKNCRVKRKRYARKFQRIAAERMEEGPRLNSWVAFSRASPALEASATEKTLEAAISDSGVFCGRVLHWEL